MRVRMVLVGPEQGPDLIVIGEGKAGGAAAQGFAVDIADLHREGASRLVPAHPADKKASAFIVGVLVD